MIRAYVYPHYANKGKTEKIKEILKEYRKTAQRLAKYQWLIFFKEGKFNKYAKIKHVQSKLSERYKQVCLWQVVSILESFISNVQNKFKQIVLSSSLDQKTKRILLCLNSKREWFIQKSEKALWMEGKERIEYEITEEERKLSRKIFKHMLNTWRKPSFKHISMHLDNKVAVSEENKRSKTFDKWLKLSTLERGNPIYVPLKNNIFAENLRGEFLNFYQIVEEEEKIKIVLVKDIQVREEYKPMVESIAIDIGLNPLIATDKGDLIGRQFFDVLKKYDEKITKRMTNLQRNGINPNQDKKYRELVKKLRAFLKNEINRFINRLVNLYKPAKIIVERVDFRSPNLSRRLNRIIQNFGKGVFKQKLNTLKEEYGIQIIEVNPAYTSQECSSCGYVYKNNRKDTNTFECKACGKKINAQVNGARNILRRASLLSVIKPFTPKKQVLKVLIKQYFERHKGCNSAPLEVLKDNPYFSDFLNPVGGGINFY
ncbi:MAG: putative transposase [Thermotogaceae bacterium]|nr:putative transposase [Thermotogaceae bacterium]